MSALSSTLDDDLKYVVTKNRFVGLWRMLKGYKFKYISANLSLGIAALAKTGTYLLLRYFIDSYFVTDNQKVALPVIAAGFLVLAAVEGGFTFISGKLAAETAEGVARRLRNYLYDHIQHLSFTFHSQTKTGELVQKATSDVEAVRRFFSDQAIGIGRIVFLFLVNFIALLNLNQQLAWISIIVVPFVVLTSVLFFRKISAAYEAYQEQDAIVSTTLQENLSGVRVVKAFARQPYEISKFDRQNWEK
ncbi:MAG: ABC transporter ATP-binding protein, partial [Anaerolineaceae bacterium]